MILSELKNSLISFSLRLGEWFWPEQDILWTIITAPILAVPIFISLGLYRTVIRFIGFQELWVVFQAVSLYALLWGIIGFMGSIEGIPRSVIIINWLLLVLALTATRAITKWLFLTLANNKNLSLKNVLIYGAGSAGRQLSRALEQSSEYRPVALIDDLIEIQNQTINGLKVISIKNLEEFYKAGATGAGLGSNLYKAGRPADEIHTIASELVAEWKRISV